MNFADAMNMEMSHTKTDNGADALALTGSRMLDFFGRIGSMRGGDKMEKLDLFDAAYNENPDGAMKLLFFARDIRGGYGERDSFNEIFAHLAATHRESAEKNIANVMEFGRASDLYSLIDTPVEDAMWAFMKSQFEADVKALAIGEPVSLLAKWIATPNSSSKKTSALGKKTAKMLGYDYKHMAQYRKTLSALRDAIDIPEKKMSAQLWDQIDYEQVPSKCMLQHRKAFARHDEARYGQYIDSVSNGTAKMNMGTANPCDIMQKVYKGAYTPELDTMWAALPTICEHNALVVADTSSSMTWDTNMGSVLPIIVATSLAIYFAERNNGCFKNKYITFSARPQLVEITGSTLKQKYAQMMRGYVGGNTNLEAVFEMILDMGVKYHIAPSDMPESILVVSDMQIDRATYGGEFMTFTDNMKKRFEAAGYALPHVVYWNVNAAKATFHAGMSDDAVSLVSGYSPNVMKQVMDNIGKTPYDLMMSVVESDRYKCIMA